MRICTAIFALALPLPAFAGGGGPDVEITVTARPALAPSPGLDAYSVTVLDRHSLALAASPRLDDALRQVPGFTLFRRTSSAVAHPTTQGVSLRGIGPNGAGRTLVLVDGVPANDPFGGWVYWNDLPAASVDSVSIIRGGGAGPWGNAAIAGTIRIETLIPEGSGARADLGAGSKGSFNGAAGIWATAGPVTIDLDLHTATSDGYHLLRAEDRGRVDRPAASETLRARLGATWRNGETLSARLSFTIHDEERNNGTPLATNDTRSYSTAVRVADTKADGNGWEAGLYMVDRTFVNRFTSVSADRESELPALFQFDVPARAYGGNVLVRRNLGAGTLEAGGDFRFVEGETNELFLLQEGRFRRERKAGGKQFLGGLFAEYTHALTAATDITGGIRLDHLRDSGGLRQERNLDTGTNLVDEAFANRDRTVINARLGVSHQWHPGVSARAVAYTGFRQPTINELYRPFRVRNDITEANPDLKPERLYGIDIGLSWRVATELTLDLTGYLTRLENGIANVFLTATPGPDPEFGVFIPPGGSLSQRRNLDVMRTGGVEAEVRWRAQPELTVTGRYLWTDAAVRRAADTPALEGRRTPQVPRHQGSLTLTWTPGDRFRSEATVRGETSRFDDAFNTRRLGGYVTLDLFAGWTLAEEVELYVAAENVFDRTYAVAVASDGLVTVGTPRLVRGGIRAAF